MSNTVNIFMNKFIYIINKEKLRLNILIIFVLTSIVKIEIIENPIATRGWYPLGIWIRSNSFFLLNSNNSPPIVIIIGNNFLSKHILKLEIVSSVLPE